MEPSLLQDYSSLQKYHDKLAFKYDSYYTDSVSTAENDVVTEMLSSFVTPGMRVLDLGCGTALGEQLVASALAKSPHSALPELPPFQYVGIDLSIEMIRRAKQRVAKNHAAFVVMNIERLAFLKPDSFDLCLSVFGSFSHVLQPAVAAIPEIYRVVKPHGHVFVMVYSRFSMKNCYEALVHGDFSRLAEVHPYACRNTCEARKVKARFYTPASIARLFACFASLRIQGLNGCLTLPLPIRSINFQYSEFQVVCRR